MVDDAKSNNFLNTFEHSKSGNVPVETLDNLFLLHWKSKPAFLHIDVEGYELDVLRGGTKVIAMYHPVFSVEAHVLTGSFAVELLSFVESLGYSVYMINEVCGVSQDCRNFLCFPHSLINSLKASPNIIPALDIAIRTGQMTQVTSANLHVKFTELQKSAKEWISPQTFP